jgi:very-short-patch-repair endonuclease
VIRERLVVELPGLNHETHKTHEAVHENKIDTPGFRVFCVFCGCAP